MCTNLKPKDKAKLIPHHHNKSQFFNLCVHFIRSIENSMLILWLHKNFYKNKIRILFSIYIAPLTAKHIFKIKCKLYYFQAKVNHKIKWNTKTWRKVQNYQQFYILYQYLKYPKNTLYAHKIIILYSYFNNGIKFQSK